MPAVLSFLLSFLPGRHLALSARHTWLRSFHSNPARQTLLSPPFYLQETEGQKGGSFVQGHKASQ